MDRVFDRVGQHDDDRLRAGVHQGPQGGPDVVLVEVEHSGARVVDALPDRADQALRDQRHRPRAAGQVVTAQLVQAFAVATAPGQRDGRLETRGDQGADPRPAPFDQGVGAEGGRVPDRINIGEHARAVQGQRGTGPVQDLTQTLTTVVGQTYTYDRRKR